MATCRDVAKKANVSRATVTRVIREPEKVAPETRKRVLQVMNELNYTVNYMASSLKSARTRAIGLIIPDIVNPFYIEFAYKLQQQLTKMNYNLIIQLSNENIEEEFNSIQFLIGFKVECLLFSPLEENEKIITNTSFYKKHLMQLFRGMYEDLSIIHVNDEVGGYLTAKRLLEAGHQDILIFEVASPGMVSSRLKGCCRAFQERGLVFPMENYIPKSINEVTIEDIKDILVERNATACIVVAYKLQELFINAINSLNKKIMEDVSVVFYDKTFFSQTYNITTITHDIDDIVNKTIKQILTRIESKGDALSKTEILPYLIEGNSIRNIE